MGNTNRKSVLHGSDSIGSLRAGPGHPVEIHLEFFEFAFLIFLAITGYGEHDLKVRFARVALDQVT